ncbi:MAG: dockerin type I domain-containing protein, partial [Patescibacteria group bacterium]|nr:dockerin type I domain-containing protein [Patescibacteria group bacterium]
MKRCVKKIYLPFLILLMGFGLAFTIRAQITPAISGVFISPESLPQGSEQKVIIRANATTIYGIKSVEALIYDAKGKLITTLPLYDDGKHHDLNPHDETFGNSLSVKDYPLGTYSITIRATAAHIFTTAELKKAGQFKIYEAMEKPKEEIEKEKEKEIIKEEKLPFYCKKLMEEIKTHFGSWCPEPEKYSKIADLNKDGYVDQSDIDFFYTKYSEPDWCYKKYFDLTDPCQYFFKREFKTEKGYLISWPHQEGYPLEKIYKLCGEKTRLFPKEDLQPGKAYWFYPEKDCTLARTGTPWIFQDIKLPQRKEVEIGAPFEKIPFSDIFGNCNYRKLVIYGYDENHYKRYYHNNYIEPGYGYSIFNQGSPCTLSLSLRVYCAKIRRAIVEGLRTTCVDEKYSPIADINKDKKIDYTDLFLFLRNWRKRGWCQAQLQKTENPCDKPSPCPPIGDIDGDSLITRNDAQFITQYVERKVKFSPEIRVIADVNDDGKVSTLDAMLISQYMIGEISIFPACPIEKDLTKYSDKEVFLISDQNWQDVLSLVPVTTWTDKKNCLNKKAEQECKKFDINGDGMVNVLDLFLCNKHFGQNWPKCDFNQNGKVDKEDLAFNTQVIKKYPTLIWHQEDFSNKIISLNKNEFMRNTSLYVYWNFKNNILAEGKVDSDEFTILFNLSEDIYDKMQKGIPRGDLKVTVQKIEAGPEKILYDVYLNKVKLENKSFFKKDNQWFLQGAFLGKEKFLLKEGENTLTLKRTGGNIVITEYQLFTLYFAIDEIDNNCFFEPGPFKIYDLCIEDIELNKDKISPNDKITYSVNLKNISNEVVDLSGEEYVFQTLGTRIPYNLIMSHISTSIPKVKLEPNQSTKFDITLVYDKVKELPDFAFDADSIIYFLQQYLPDKLTIIGNSPSDLDRLLIAPPTYGAGLKESQIQRISVNDYLSYWKGIREIVYVEADYEKALLASTYASLKNAPLIIQGTANDTPNVFMFRNVILVGNVSCPAYADCIESYLTLDSLQEKYVELVEAKDFILVNPDDLDILIFDTFIPNKPLNADPVHNLYFKTSLAAPFLASAKHELILSTKSTDYQTIDQFLKQKLSQFISYPFYSCVPPDPCAQGFDKEITFNVARPATLTFNRAATSGPGDIYFGLAGFLFDCPSKKEDVKIYVNDKIVHTLRNWSCYNLNEIVPDPDLFSIWHRFSMEVPAVINTVRLEFNGNLALPKEPGFILKNKTTGQEVKWEDIKDVCAPALATTSVFGFAQGEASISFQNIDLNYNYNLALQAVGSGKLSLSIDGQTLGETTWLSPSYWFSNSFKIPKELLKETLTISLISSSTSTFYKVKAHLVPKLENSLTVFASPPAIPIAENMPHLGGYQNRRALDPSLYADLVDNRLPDIGVGRIMGFTPSDVSSYIARDLFYEEFIKTNNMKFLASSFPYMINNANRWAKRFREIGYNAISVTNPQEAYNFDPAEWKNQDLIHYLDHGSLI